MAAAVLVAAACAHAPASHPSGPARTGGPGRAAEVEEGLASFYADGLAGRPTASGAPYDPAAFTCAHRDAPFGARLKVTDLKSGRSVVVRVNDRGPFVSGRIVDLSRAAARAIGLLERGVAPVRVERLD